MRIAEMKRATTMNNDFFCVGVMYSGEYDACDVTSQASYSPEYITPTQKKNVYKIHTR
jgi:hypothetical protein